MRIFEQIKNGLRAKFECLKVILSQYLENLGVLLLFRILSHSKRLADSYFFQ